MRQFCTLLLSAAFLCGCGEPGDDVTTADPAAGETATADTAAPEATPADPAPAPTEPAETDPADPAAADTPPADAPPTEPAPVDAPPADPPAPPADSDSPAAATPADDKPADDKPAEDKPKPGTPAEGAVLPAMQDFMKALDGSEDGVAAAYKKHAAEDADNPDDIDLMLLEKPKVLKTEMKDGQTCYTLETHAGISIRIWEICWKDGKISSAILKDTKFP